MISEKIKELNIVITKCLDLDPMLTKVLSSNMDPNKNLAMASDQDLPTILMGLLSLIQKSTRTWLILA